MAPTFKFLVFSSLLALLLHGTHAVEYTVTNRAETTPGGIRFNNEIGAEYTKQSMEAATAFIFRLFQQNTEAERKTPIRQVIPLYVDDIQNDGLAAYASNDEIYVVAKWIASIQGDSRRDFTGVVYHELTHVWQFDGSKGNKAPMGLIDGIADFVRLKAGYEPNGWVQRGEGAQWDQGYDVTARFLDYCNDLRNGFVAELNKKMRETYSDDFFVQLLGKSVGQLWSEYKALYGKN